MSAAEKQLESARAAIYKPLASLRCWSKNYRHGDVDAIAASIAQFGFNGALRVWRDETVIAGNHAKLALDKMRADGKPAPNKVIDYEDEWLIPCIDVSHLDEDSAHAFAIADNHTQEIGSNDNAALAAMLQSLAAESLAATGYDDDDLKALLAGVAEVERKANPTEDAGPQIDKADDLQGVWKVERGQIWSAGKHRVMCGDSCDEGDVGKLLGGNRIALLSTDPPYGVSYVAKARDMHKNGYVHSHSAMNTDIESDELKGDKLIRFLVSALRPGISRAAEQCAVYVWHPDARRREFMAALDELEIFQHQIVEWLKPGFVIGRCNYHHRFEPCFHGWPQGKRPDFLGERNQSNVWEFGRENDKIHPTQKPTDIFQIPMRNHTRAGDICYEPFAGSGTQLVAGEIEDREVYAMEITEKYVAVCLQRLTDLGLEPKLL
jgi:hypothetical protein